MLGTTFDESVGEAFDKVSRALKIKWNKVVKEEENTNDDLLTIETGDSIEEIASGGGPGAALEKIAIGGDPHSYKFTVPLNDMHKRHQIKFSFSGLRTQVTRAIEKEQPNFSSGVELEGFKANIAASFQYTICEHLRLKLDLALKECKKLNIPLNSIVASGGVASNTSIRDM